MNSDVTAIAFVFRITKPMPRATIEANEESLDKIADEYDVVERTEGEIVVEVPSMGHIFAYLKTSEIPTDHLSVVTES